MDPYNNGFYNSSNWGAANSSIIRMSMEYCVECDKMIDLDDDAEHECFEGDEDESK
ncbi:hypothetical protein LCGC14_2307510 [marine sediment metagenome]|uniref:Uncharacterized protein n=1 Tax=marine sediment metagenome TaxID=412755 RepID=A0A0F9CM34_9ZZZZ